MSVGIPFHNPFDDRVKAAINELGELTIPLGEKYGPSALLLALARNTALGLRYASPEIRDTVLKDMRRFAEDEP